MAAHILPVTFSREPQSVRSATIATGNWVATTAVKVTHQRTAILEVKSVAGSADNIVQIIPLYCPRLDADATPGAADWRAFPVTDGSVTGTVVDGTMPSNYVNTVAPEWGVVKYRPLCIQLENADAASDTVFLGIPLNLAGVGAAWVSALVKDDDGSGTLATVTIKIALV